MIKELLKNNKGNIGGMVFVAIFALVLLAVGGYMMYQITTVANVSADSAYKAPIDGLAGNFTTIVGIVVLVIIIMLIGAALAYFAGVMGGNAGGR